jgi:hypothetical protein
MASDMAWDTNQKEDLERDSTVMVYSTVTADNTVSAPTSDTATAPKPAVGLELEMKSIPDLAWEEEKHNKSYLPPNTIGSLAASDNSIGKLECNSQSNRTRMSKCIALVSKEEV